MDTVIISNVKPSALYTSALYTSALFPSAFTDELKLPYKKNLKKGFIFAVLIHLFVIGAYAFFNYYNNYLKDQDIKNTQQRVINVTLTDLEPPPALVEDEIPPKIEELLTPPPKDLQALTPQPVAKEKADIQTIKTQKELEEIKTPVSSTGDSGSFVFSGQVKIEDRKIEQKFAKEEKKENREKTVFQQFEVEKAPEAVNLAQVKSLIVYPDAARELGIEGKVTVKILVGTDGSIVKLGAVNGPEVFYDEVREKTRLIVFTPGLQNGKPVNVWVTVPFNFVLR